jgi:hypothetical protein
MDSMCHNIYRWERGADGLSERYKLHYCHALAIPASLQEQIEESGRESVAAGPQSLPCGPG